MNGGRGVVSAKRKELETLYMDAHARLAALRAVDGAITKLDWTYWWKYEGTHRDHLGVHRSLALQEHLFSPFNAPFNAPSNTPFNTPFRRPLILRLGVP